MNFQSEIFTKVSWVRRVKNYLMLFLLGFASLVAILPLGFILFHVVSSGYTAINLDFFTQLPAPIGEEGGGMANALVGSGVMLLMASTMAMPIGFFAGVYLSEYGKSRFISITRFVVDLLASVPSIVVGLFVYAVIVAPMKTYSAWAGSVALAVLMIPVMIKGTEEVLRLMPDHVREAGLALGLPRWRVILSVVTRGSRKALITVCLLTFARVAGETAPLLFTAFGNNFWLQSMSQPAPSLPVQIYFYAISPYQSFHQQAWAGAFLLLSFVFVVNLTTRVLSHRKS